MYHMLNSRAYYTHSAGRQLRPRTDLSGIDISPTAVVRSSGTIIFIRHIANILALSFALTTVVAGFSHCKGKKENHITNATSEDLVKHTPATKQLAETDDNIQPEEVDPDKIESQVESEPEIKKSVEEVDGHHDTNQADNTVSDGKQPPNRDTEADGVPIIGGASDQDLIEDVDLSATRNALIELEQRAARRQ